jgi:hypothetical protein
LKRQLVLAQVAVFVPGNRYLNGDAVSTAYVATTVFYTYYTQLLLTSSNVPIEATASTAPPLVMATPGTVSSVRAVSGEVTARCKGVSVPPPYVEAYRVGTFVLLRRTGGAAFAFHSGVSTFKVVYGIRAHYVVLTLAPQRPQCNRGNLSGSLGRNEEFMFI